MTFAAKRGFTSQVFTRRADSCRRVSESIALVGEISAIRALLERYQDAPMDFADACVVRMADSNPGYRLHYGRPFRVPEVH